MWEGLTHRAPEPEQVALGCSRKQAKEAVKRSQEAGFLPGLHFRSCLQVTVLTFLRDTLCLQGEMKSLFPKLHWCFVKAIETLTKTNRKSL